MIHYELILLYASGLSPKDAINIFGYSRSSAYRFNRIYRDARKRAVAIITRRDSVSPGRGSSTNKLDHLKPKKGRPPREKKAAMILNKETGEYEKIFL